MSLESQKIWTWRRINGLSDPIRTLAWALIGYCSYKHDIHLTVTQGYRSDEQQAELYEQGRSKPGRIVTWAKAGESNHNHRKAFDVAILDDSGLPTWPEDNDLWKKIGDTGMAMGLNWGGVWSNRDLPHFETKER